MSMLERLKSASGKMVLIKLKAGQQPLRGMLIVGENVLDKTDVVIAVQAGASLTELTLDQIEDVEVQKPN